MTPSPSAFRRLCAIVVCGAALLASCRRASVGSPSKSTPVILISIDTLRSDHLPSYGYTKVETPNIDALRADSILYSRAYSHVPLTLPSHASILSGMLPSDHGVRDNIGFRVGEQIPLVQELLKKNGYATGGAVSAFVLRHETGLGRGFDFFDDEVEPMNPAQTVIGRVQRDGRDTVQSIERWIDGVAGRPFFAFVHLYEPHTPYTPPEPWATRYASQPYDGEIAYVDALVGELVAHLKAKKVYDDALIIFLSDHGEGLNDHAEEEHGIFLYREALQVPLLVKLPKNRKAGATVETPVELVDVFPTILERTATAPPSSGKHPGESLLAFLDGGRQRPIYAETYYPRFHFGWSDLHSLIDGNDHFIRAPQPELYDLAADPAEKKNTLEKNRRAYVRLRQAIEPFVVEATTPANVDPEEAAKLAALGYVGSTVSTKPGEILPDPKTTVGVFHDIRLAFTWYRDKKNDDALQLTDKLLADNPQITDLWDLKCKILNQMGRPKAAIEAAKDGLRRVPTSIALLFDVANGALALGELDDAKQHAEIAVKIEPGEAHEILSRIALRRGDQKTAEAEGKLALETSHDPTAALTMLAAIERDRGNPQAALAYLDKAVERLARKGAPKRQSVHSARGDILARLSRNDEAERELRTEIEQFPKNAEAYASLIMLLVTERRVDEATKLVYAAVEAAPEPHTFAVVAETLTAIGDDRGALFWAYQGIRKYPANAELRQLPARLREAAPMLRKRLAAPGAS